MTFSDAVHTLAVAVGVALPNSGVGTRRTRAATGVMVGYLAFRLFV